MAKYRVYGNYIFSKVLGEYEAESEEKAIEKALDEADCNATLCVHCSRKFVDAGALDEDSNLTFCLSIKCLNHVHNK